MTRLHEGRFSQVHEKWTLLDKHIKSDVNTTRLRVYSIYSFAQIALSNTSSGEFLNVGISYGTTPLIISELLKQKIQGRSFYFVDPMQGSLDEERKNIYNTDFAYNTSDKLVIDRWDKDIPLHWIKSYLKPSILKNLPNLAFVQLNTGDFNSELKSLKIIFQKLVKGGFIILDIYGWESADVNKIDSLLKKIKANSFQLITRQLVIFK